jgi:hypothetical protein
VFRGGVAGETLVEDPAIVFDETHKAIVIVKARFPNQRTVSKYPNRHTIVRIPASSKEPRSAGRGMEEGDCSKDYWMI